MRPPDTCRVRVSRRRRPGRSLQVLFVGGLLLLAGAAPALGQAEYTGIPPTVPPADVYVVDTYVGTYAGTAPGVATLVASGVRPSGITPQLASSGTISVAGAALGDAPAVDEGDPRLVTGWDVVTIGALGLTAVVAFAVAAARFRSP